MSLYLVSALSCAPSLHGAISEGCSPVRVITSRGRRRHALRTIGTRKEEISNSHGFVSCSASGRVHDGSVESGYSSKAEESGVRTKMATNQSTPPIASVTNTVFTSVSTPFADRLENFDKLNWKGKVTVSAVVVASLAAASFAGVKLARGLHRGVEKFGSKKGGGKENGGGSLAYDVVAKGFSTVESNLGPWSFSDLTLGLAAISKLPESTIVAAEWNPCQETLRPAYAVFVDAPHGAVVLSVRGTSEIVDMLVNSGASADPFLDGQAHGGFAKATDNLLKEAVPHLKKAFEEQSKSQKDLKLVITGHSMGAAVGIMAGMKLNQSSDFSNLECWGYSTPACVTLEVARECKDYATSFIAHHDVVPRFSIAAVELLRKRICDFDWESADKLVGEDDDWSNIRSAADNLQSAQDKQKEMYKSMEEAQEGVGEQVDNVKEKFGQPLCNDNDADKKSPEENEEEKKEHPPLYPPGRLFVLVSDPPGSGKLPEDRSDVASGRSSGTYPTFEEVKKVTWLLHEADQEDLKEIVISPWCVSDHMIGNLGEGIGNLQRHCEPAFGGSAFE